MPDTNLKRTSRLDETRVKIGYLALQTPDEQSGLG